MDITDFKKRSRHTQVLGFGKFITCIILVFGFLVIDLFRYTLIDKGALYFSSLLLFSDKSLLHLYCNNQSIGLRKRRDHEDLCAETLCIRYLTHLQFSLCIQLRTTSCRALYLVT